MNSQINFSLDAAENYQVFLLHQLKVCRHRIRHHKKQQAQALIREAVTMMAIWFGAGYTYESLWEGNEAKLKIWYRGNLKWSCTLQINLASYCLKLPNGQRLNWQGKDAKAVFEFLKSM